MERIKIQKECKKLSKELAYIFGVRVSDGHLINRKGRYILMLTVKDYDYALEFKNSVEKWCGKEIKIRRNKRGYWCINFLSKEHISFIDSFDLKRLLKADDNIKCSFLKAFFDGEGNVLFAGSHARQIRCGVTDLNLISFVKELLNSIGIETSRISFQTNQCYLIRITHRINLNKFYEKVGFAIKRKQDKLREIVNSYVLKTYKQRKKD